MTLGDDTDNLVVTGTIEYPEPPPNTWREVCTATGGCVIAEDAPIDKDCPTCPYYTRTGLAEVIDWRALLDMEIAAHKDTQKRMQGYLDEMGHLLARLHNAVEAWDSLIACYEELAVQYNVTNQILHEVMAEPDGHLVASEDQVSVRPYVRAKPRRSRTAPEARAEASPTGDKDIESGESQAKAGEDRDGTWTDGEGVPEAFIGVTLWECERCHRAVYRLDHDCIPQSPESSDLIRQGLEDCAEGRVSKYEERSE